MDRLTQHIIDRYKNLLENSWTCISTMNVVENDVIGNKWKKDTMSQIQEGLQYLEGLNSKAYLVHPSWLPEEAHSVREWASEIHGNELYGDKPYMHHLDAVAHVLIRFGIKDLDLIRAAYGHDAMENRGLSFKDIRTAWGLDVANIIYDLSDEMGHDRNEKKAKTYPKLRANMKSVIVKVADRIANMEEEGKTSMYVKEFEEFQMNLRIFGHVPEMWEHLSKLVETARNKVHSTPKK